MLHGTQKRQKIPAKGSMFWGPGFWEKGKNSKNVKNNSPAEQVGPGWEEQSRQESEGVTLPRVMLVVLLFSLV